MAHHPPWQFHMYVQRADLGALRTDAGDTGRTTRYAGSQT